MQINATNWHRHTEKGYELKMLKRELKFLKTEYDQFLRTFNLQEKDFDLSKFLSHKGYEPDHFAKVM